MKTAQLLEDLVFHPDMPYAQPLLVDKDVRILRWTLKPGQRTDEHAVPDSPFYAVVLKGRGVFTGSGGQEEVLGPYSLIILAVGEGHSVRALDDELVFVSFIHGAEVMRPDRTGGEIGREQD